MQTQILIYAFAICFAKILAGYPLERRNVVLALKKKIESHPAPAHIACLVLTFGCVDKVIGLTVKDIVPVDTDSVILNC